LQHFWLLLWHVVLGTANHVPAKADVCWTITMKILDDRSDLDEVAPARRIEEPVPAVVVVDRPVVVPQQEPSKRKKRAMDCSERTKPMMTVVPIDHHHVAVRVGLDAARAVPKSAVRAAPVDPKRILRATRRRLARALPLVPCKTTTFNLRRSLLPCDLEQMFLLKPKFIL